MLNIIIIIHNLRYLILHDFLGDQNFALQCVHTV